MYILVRDEAPDYIVPNSTAHGSLMGHLEWSDNDHPCNRQYDDWLANHFNKVTCRVTDAEWNLVLSEISNYIIVTESRLNDMEICMVVHPILSGHPTLNNLKLWKPKK